ncbi:DUF305 domain-containing protein [Agromyces aerolatus]|uniref:DUF305 domain-containing protein n=1 Tax=Agromyces sp. LY-1074 TaxID=3074080 RepID=UPI0028583959|nr:MULTISPECIES: DUF305 domain-containing protein [unclassified Agromyces]MDR5699506.1 DUF305 domain-containing protein [Agromyces sp. LY-1074]MDR5705802.1 DUF305 domain-containing protein [Agromyces sp. LY-1358]
MTPPDGGATGHGEAASGASEPDATAEHAHDVPGPAPRGRRLAVLVAAGIAIVVVAVVAFSIGRLSSLGVATPSDRSADAGFSRDMQVHHLQGVEMAMIIRGISDADDMQHLSYDIATTQAQQAGQMYGWLEEWGLSQFSAEPMAWMAAEGGHAHGSTATDATDGADATDAVMPGMATPAQMQQLRDSTGVEAERLFLELMIAHHLGAVEMAEAAQELADTPVVLRLADSVVQSQEAEISLMERMLADRGPLVE